MRPDESFTAPSLEAGAGRMYCREEENENTGGGGGGGFKNKSNKSNSFTLFS